MNPSIPLFLFRVILGLVMATIYLLRMYTDL